MEIVDRTRLMATPEGQARNAEIYRTAAELMVEKGFGGTSIGDIAQAVGMTKSGLYHHIASKQDMLYKIMTYVMDSVEEVVVEPTRTIADPEERLREIMRLHVNGLIKYGPAMSVLMWEVNHLESAGRTEIVNRKKAYHQYVQFAVEELEAAGRLQVQGVKMTTQHILSTIRGIARWYSPNKSPKVNEVVEETINFVTRAILKPS
jgi:AcrR family transcriptional regulator